MKQKKKGDEKPKYHLYNPKANTENRAYTCGVAGFIITFSSIRQTCQVQTASKWGQLPPTAQAHSLLKVPRCQLLGGSPLPEGRGKEEPATPSPILTNQIQSLVLGRKEWGSCERLLPPGGLYLWTELPPHDQRKSNIGKVLPPLYPWSRPIRHSILFWGLQQNLVDKNGSELTCNEPVSHPHPKNT